MKDLIFKLSLLIFMISMLMGFYENLPFIDNIVRSFVVFCLFFISVWILMLVYVHTVAGLNHQNDRTKYNSTSGDGIKTANL